MPTSNVLRKKLAESNLKKLEQIHLTGSGAVAELETKLEKFYGMKYALCVSNASMGLLAIALTLDLRKKEFITTPYTYGASLAGWLMLGNRPIFADINPHSLGLDPGSVHRRMNTKIKAILAVDIYGTPSDTKKIRKLADEFGVWYIADAAQSMGASFDGVKASSQADALVVSFTTGKTVFAGEGGAILTNNDDLYEKLIWHTQHPMRQRSELGLNLDNEFAVNGRIHPLAAIIANTTFAAALSRLRKHQEWCLKTVSILNDIGLTEPICFSHKKIMPSFFRMTAAWRNGPKESELDHEMRRQGLRANLTAAPVRIIYHQSSFQAQYASWIQHMTHCPNAERQAAKRFCLSEKQISHV
jgi:perosamine synthetase